MKKKYKSYRNELNHLVRIAKKNYYSKKLEQAGNDLKSTWKAINELISKKKQTNRNLPSSFVDNDNNISDPELIANNFNQFFVNIGPNLAKGFDKSSTKSIK